ncbi:cell division protein FtsZ [Woodsholea maritima]|uniref:cell division protein FtsZ n=1 Tax=Woodsholea maritima TaxID=240237 RepID=UPI00036ED692|nr:cell division protein FtsZ [Woodsholea maritima]
MALNLSLPETTELKPRIVVFGVGGAGGNAVNNMIEADLEGVDFVVANTDAQALTRSKTDRRIQMGAGITEGLGAGARPEVGEQSAEDSLAEILEHLSGAHMVFITAGMGGGTGTGAAPVIARAAREQGILTVGVVTKPFHFEGSRRMKLAEAGIEQLQAHVDTLIVIPNQNLFRIATEKTTFAEAFSMADQVLHSGVRGITDLMVMPGLINLDFADVRTVMSEMGKAMMGTGEAEGEKRAIEAAHAAIANPLLDDVSMKGARGVLINITGGMDMTLYEVDEAANEIRNEVDPDANIIVGSTFDMNMEGTMRVSVVATGIECEEHMGSGRDGGVVNTLGVRTNRPQRQAEPLIRRTADAVAVNETPKAVSRQSMPPASLAEREAWAASQAPEASETKPAVVRSQERLAEVAPGIAKAEAKPEPKEEKRGFSLFGRRPKQEAPKPQSKVAPQVEHKAQTRQNDGFDEEELEIPAFLRRQAN